MSLSGHEPAFQPQSTSNGTFLPTPRQIRFVSTDSQPHAKRRRISAACTTCRKRKTRCSGEKPECRTCTDNGHVCVGYARKHTRKVNDKSFDIDEEIAPEHRSLSTHRSSKDSHTTDTGCQTACVVQKDDSSGLSPPIEGDKQVRVNLRSPESTHTINSASAIARTRVPFFRYFGPTAIVPGFKQMVVQIKDRAHRSSFPSTSGDPFVFDKLKDVRSDGHEASPEEIVFYDATDDSPNPVLVTHLCESFFTNLGCNYPFLQRERFMKDLEEKRVDAILVDAVCAIGARFSLNPSLARPSDQNTPIDEKGEVKRAFRGQPYAQRAASSLVDTFGRPTMAVVQACLLLAYEEFGTDRDSGLWMFLGTSIRMSQDLGIQKLEGLQLEGRIGPTPKTVKATKEDGRHEEAQRRMQQEKLTELLVGKCDRESLEGRRASEQERLDTFWAVFFLDRAVSSGVGRPVTLCDKDIEISFPFRTDEEVIEGYPHPFSIMIRIVHLYGRIADVINNIQGLSRVNQEGLKELASMEKDLTGIYQNMSPKLHFNATNFQHYVKAKQGTNFILLHFWFHTSIILLHQPTLMCSLDTQMQQLFPDSRELSMSSAKTIADILAFAELIDVKSFIGNPFTSQPMYVAACAFLAEARAHASLPSSRQTSPPSNGNHRTVDVKLPATGSGEQRLALSSKPVAKYSLLATAASQNYQRCYKALKLLDSYWAGCRYILTVLDQKSKGLMDPILFTQEDIDGEMPSVEPAFTQPGWRRSSLGTLRAGRHTSVTWSPRMDWSQAIGWSLTGTTNSPAPNLSFLYPHPTSDGDKNESYKQQEHHVQQYVTQLNDMRKDSLSIDPDSTRPMMPPPRQKAGAPTYGPVSTADADLLLGLHSPFSVSPNTLLTQEQATTSAFGYGTGHSPPSHMQPQQPYTFAASDDTPDFMDMLIESQDIDMGNQLQGHWGFDNLDFPGNDMIRLEYLPQDVLSYFSQAEDPPQPVVQPSSSSTATPSAPASSLPPTYRRCL